MTTFYINITRISSSRPWRKYKFKSSLH